MSIHPDRYFLPLPTESWIAQSPHRTPPPFKLPNEKKIKRPHSFWEMGSPFFSPKPFFHPAWVKEGYRKAKLLFQPKRLWRKENMLSIGKFETKLAKNTLGYNNFPVHSWIINHHRVYSDIFDTG
jgi:hypothetical protein